MQLILVPAKDDAKPFSVEYQAELSVFASKAGASSQRAFSMDSAIGGGGPLGEFIFNNSETLIGAVSVLGVAWIGRRTGRKLRIKVGEIEIEATSKEEVAEMVTQVKLLQEQKVVPHFWWLGFESKKDKSESVKQVERFESESAAIKRREQIKKHWGMPNRITIPFTATSEAEALQRIHLY